METVRIFISTLASDYTVSLFPEPQPEPVAPTLPWFVWMWFIGGGLLAVGVAVGVFLLIRHAVRKGRGRKAAEAADAAEIAGIAATANTAEAAGIAGTAAPEEDRV